MDRRLVYLFALFVLLVAAFSGWAAVPVRAVAILRATETGSTADTCGTSWATACSLQKALAKAANGDEIWVAGGVYKPTANPVDRETTFQLKANVALYGGFDGVSDELRTDRNPTAHPTILSGDIDNNDSQKPVITNIKSVAGNGSNSYHVVAGANTARLDGFTITGGYANGPGFPATNCGGGMQNLDANPIISDVNFSGNSAHMGGGMCNDYGSPSLTNVTFNNNSADSYGGGIYNWWSNLNLTNSTFNGNSASRGGGMFNDSSSATLTSVTVYNNSASLGGGISNYLSSLSIHSSLFWGNTAGSDGSQIHNGYGGEASVSDSVVQGGYPGGTNIITTDPKLGPLGLYGGFTPTLPLQHGSSALDVLQAPCPSSSDQRGVARPQGIACDLGAFEGELNVFRAVENGSTADMCGDSWAAACSLQKALAKSSSNDEIWVAGGVYTPTGISTDRNATIQLTANVGLYGGFDGVSDDERTDRHPGLHPTILSGDIDHNDSQQPVITDLEHVTGNATNSYSVVRGANAALLDGFTITAGNANGSVTCPSLCGGGMANYSSSPILMNVTFSGNSGNTGGGMYNDSSDPTLMNVTFSGNSGDTGGGMYNASSSPTLTNVIFNNNNSAGSGGGMCNASSSPTLTNVTFNGNSAGAYGGGMVNHSSDSSLTNVTFNSNSASIHGGGMYNDASSPGLTNITFSGNSAAQYGGGLYNQFGSPSLTNLTFKANSAGEYGGGMFNFNSSPSTRNSLFWGNTAGSGGAQIYDDEPSDPIVIDCVVQGGYVGGTNIIVADPKLGPLGMYGGFTPTLPLQSGSSALDVLDPSACPPADQRGVARPQGLLCDLGAFEGKLDFLYLPLLRR